MTYTNNFKESIENYENKEDLGATFNQCSAEMGLVEVPGEKLDDSMCFTLTKAIITSILDFLEVAAVAGLHPHRLLNDLFAKRKRINGITSFDKIYEAKSFIELKNALEELYNNCTKLLHNEEIKKNPDTYNPIKALIYGLRWFVRTIADKLDKKQPEWTYSKAQRFLSGFNSHVETSLSLYEEDSSKVKAKAGPQLG